MTLVCRTCQRVNPAAAQYCYFDGVALLNGATGLGPVEAGTQPFLSPFIFPSGRPCRNFDELVLAAQEEWSEAQELLREGYFAVFLGGVGRADLARLAKQARESPDPDRALDDFLSQLPSTIREPAGLHVQPGEVNLGRVTRSESRPFVLRLENKGMCLLHGSITCDDTPWLVLGDPPGVPRKLFECRHDLGIPVQVLGERLRAGNKPIEGRLVIESNGGTQTILVRAEVPVTPFPEGVLAGATTPRQVAEKAKAAAKQAIPLFEKGAVAEWYKANGWVYPIQGPPAAGLGAVQQFFEALGLTTPPRVEISELYVKLQGTVGASLEHVLKATAVENRPVFAHASSGVPWLRIGKVIPEGRTARIYLEVPSVPDAPGETLLAKVQVAANGNQRFTVAVSLTITAGVRVQSRPAVPVPDPVLLMPETLAPASSFAAAPAPLWTPPLVDEAPTLLPAPPVAAGFQPTDAGSRVRQNAGATDPRVLANAATRAASAGSKPAATGRKWPHLIPFGLIVLGLLGVVFHDVRLDPADRVQGKQEQPPPEAPTDFTAYVIVQAHNHTIKKGEDATPDGGIFLRPTMRFGLLMAKEKDPKNKNRNKRLTFDPWGRSNNTCLRIDDKEILFGDARGTWIARERPLPQDRATKTPLGSFESVWQFQDIAVTQRVEVVHGGQSRRLDTCLVQYTLADTRQNGPARPVGIRFLLDTYIGTNDGVPFTIPGQPDLCNTMQAFDTPTAVPDFIEALEKDDLKDPGTVARLQFRLGKRLEPPTRVFLGGWPDRDLKGFGYRNALGEMTLWDVPRVSMRELHNRARRRDPDSAVTIYWDDKPLDPGGRREVGFTYGLGNVVKGDKLLLTVGGHFVPEGEFTLTALVHEPGEKEKLTLTLPPGFEFLPGSVKEQEVPPLDPRATRRNSTVTWRIKAGAVGTYKLKVESSSGIAQNQPIGIYPAKKGSSPGVFD